MKRKSIIALMFLSISFSLVACSSNKSGDESAVETPAETNSATKETDSVEEPTDLTGVWVSEENEGSYQEAIIDSSTISINWISDGGNTSSVYWVGSYEAPSESVNEYSWISERNKEQTDSALLASSDDTKTFSYKDGVISYEVSALGTTTTLELTQTSTEIPENPSLDNSGNKVVSSESEQSLYDITYENISFFTDSTGGLCGQAIVEVTNTSSSDLFLDYSSYELRSEDGTIIHTTSSSFIPYPDIIKPGESGYYYECVLMDTGTPTEGISISSHLSVAPAQNDIIRLEVANTQIYDKNDIGNIDLHGEVTNTTDQTLELLNVAAVLFDNENKPIGVINTVLDTIQPGENMGFELEAYNLPEDISTQDIADYTVFAYPSQFQF